MFSAAFNDASMRMLPRAIICVPRFVSRWQWAPRLKTCRCNFECTSVSIYTNMQNPMWTPYPTERKTSLTYPNCLSYVGNNTYRSRSEVARHSATGTYRYQRTWIILKSIIHTHGMIIYSDHHPTPALYLWLPTGIANFFFWYKHYFDMRWLWRIAGPQNILRSSRSLPPRQGSTPHEHSWSILYTFQYPDRSDTCWFLTGRQLHILDVVRFVTT